MKIISEKGQFSLPLYVTREGKPTIDYSVSTGTFYYSKIAYIGNIKVCFGGQAKSGKVTELRESSTRTILSSELHLRQVNKPLSIENLLWDLDRKLKKSPFDTLEDVVRGFHQKHNLIQLWMQSILI